MAPSVKSINNSTYRKEVIERAAVKVRGRREKVREIASEWKNEAEKVDGDDEQIEESVQNLKTPANPSKHLIDEKTPKMTTFSANRASNSHIRFDTNSTLGGLKVQPGFDQITLEEAMKGHLDLINNDKMDQNRREQLLRLIEA